MFSFFFTIQDRLLNTIKNVQFKEVCSQLGLTIYLSSVKYIRSIIQNRRSE